MTEHLTDQSPLDAHHVVYVGSFDPFTLGHEHIVKRAAKIFDRVTVGIGINPDKESLLTSDERFDLTQRVLAPIKNVEVKCFTGLAVNFVRKCGAGVILRGVRTLTDMEAEFTMSLANSRLDSGIETVFLTASESYTHISSSLIKQIAHFERDPAGDRLRKFVPEPVVDVLIEKYRAV
ncbi:MAG: pantetheine-phosphate adenylyltransferase [Planctomycetota bacterium]|nr:pantetheine-phosphate adenylyltransferase [Planctomycetota bacterium]